MGFLQGLADLFGGALTRRAGQRASLIAHEARLAAIKCQPQTEDVRQRVRLWEERVARLRRGLGEPKGK